MQCFFHPSHNLAHKNVFFSVHACGFLLSFFGNAPSLVDLDREKEGAYIPTLADEWGHSSIGRALQWHCRGRRFDPAWLHQHRIRHRTDTVHSPRHRGFFICLPCARPVPWGVNQSVISRRLRRKGEVTPSRKYLHPVANRRHGSESPRPPG